MVVQQIRFVRERWMVRLRPRGDRIAASSATSDVLARALSKLGPGPVEWAVEAGAELLAELRRSTADYGAPPSGPRGVETELLSLLLQLYEGRPVGNLRVPDVVLDDARSLAHCGVPSTILVEAVWRRHRLVQESIMAAASAYNSDMDDQPDRAEWDDLLRLTRYSEQAARLLLAAYDGADRWSDERAARRRDAVSRLIDGEPLSAVEEDLIGVRLNGHHLVATVSGASGSEDPSVTRFTRAVSALLPGCSVVSLARARDVTVPRTHETVLWWSRNHPITHEELELLRRLAVPDGLAVATGDLHQGAPGVAQSYAEARRAAVVAAISEKPGPTVHADVLLVSALLADPVATRALVARELAGVLGRDTRSVELRQTLLLFLRSGGSRQAAAQELGMAPTSVAYRVDRFERLRGRPLTDSRLETWLALTVVDLAPSLLDELSGTGG
ncbi:MULTISPECIES: helix-turn-helix domain-containing protein [unclassified Nocardioides]|uniref:helix-turn-helix domain-containing protein n=1 Tax=unclassified Nocardioides TaxID=2615069 RepID=UPI003014EF90